MHLINNFIFGDEFLIYAMRKPNTKNDIIWARSIADIPDEIRYRKVAKWPNCIGLFVAFSVYGLMYIVKRAGQKWDGRYFRGQVIHEIRAWVDEEHVVDDKRKITMVHDKGPGWKANATQNLLKVHFGNNGYIPAKETEGNKYPPWPGTQYISYV